jgi:chemotaxis protein MotB
MNPEELNADAAPGWTVTYADLMSLLLTFFILLAAMSEIRENDKYQGVADSLHEQFGRASTTEGAKAGEFKPRNALFASLALAGRAKRKSLLQNPAMEAKNEAEVSPRVRVVRSGERTTVGTVVYFDQSSTELTAEACEDLVETAELLRGKPQKIEIRGHTAPSAASEIGGNAWTLAFERATATMNFLVEQLQIEPKRIRLSVAGAYEPASVSADPEAQQANTRVEVFLLDEVVDLQSPETTAGLPSIDVTNSPRRF